MSTGFIPISRREFVIGTSIATTSLLVRRSLAADANPVVLTTSGRVRGQIDSGVAVFKGIPYGAWTGGEHRFMPPRPAAKWAGIREAFEWGPSAPQTVASWSPGTPITPAFATFLKKIWGDPIRYGHGIPQSEDCLRLNVWTMWPPGAEPRPVMVWLHGGGFDDGTASAGFYVGQNLSRKGDVVVVTINHRLNALGYLHLGDLNPRFAKSGNAGQLDIVLALSWVRDNIASFGGDPSNVTIFGQSGGGWKVSALLAMPVARGLFHKGIIQSGPGLRMAARDIATALAQQTVKNLKLDRSQLGVLLRVPAEDLVTAGNEAESAMASRDPAGFAPVVDGKILPNDPFDPVAPTVSASVPIMIGTNKDEAAAFLGGDPIFGSFTDQDVIKYLVTIAPERRNEVLAAYRVALPNANPTQLLVALGTARGWLDSIILAERKAIQHAAPVFMYRFDWGTPVSNGIYGALHGLETPFVFNNLWTLPPDTLGPGSEPQQLADKMSQAWINFARSGNPSQPGLSWPPYESTSRKTMIFDAESRVVLDPDRALRQIWSA